MSRNTVRKYVGDDGERRRRASPRRARPVLDGVSERIEEILQEWSARTTGKQRITRTLVHGQLLREGYRVGSTTVRARHAAPGDACKVAQVYDWAPNSKCQPNSERIAL